MERYSKHYVYLHRTPNGIPIYVGIGTKFHGEHESFKKRYARAYANTRNIYWKRVVAKYSFEVEILLESNDYELIKQQEIHFIKHFGRADKKEGTLCNFTDGGEGLLGKIYSEKDRNNISIGQKKRFANPSQEDILVFRKLYESTSLRMIGNTYAKGNKLTQEQKDNLYIKRLEKLSKRVIQEDLEGNFIKEWYTTVEVANHFGITYKAIWKACSNYHKGATSQKFKWRFKE